MHLGPTLSPLCSEVLRVDGDFTVGFSLCLSIKCSWHGLSPRRSERAPMLPSHHHHLQRHHLLGRISSPMGALDLQQSQSDCAKTCQHISSLNSTKSYTAGGWVGGYPEWYCKNLSGLPNLLSFTSWEHSMRMIPASLLAYLHVVGVFGRIGEGGKEVTAANCSRLCKDFLPGHGLISGSSRCKQYKPLLDLLAVL